MATLEGLKTVVAANTVATDAVVAALNSAGGPDIPQSEIDAVSASVQANNDKLNAALGTPSTPVPPVPGGPVTI